MVYSERDWKDELEDFVHFVGNLKETKSRELPIEFPYEVEELDKLCELAEALERRIDMAKNV